MRQRNGPWDGWAFGGFSAGTGGRSRWRMYDRGDLKFVILKLLCGRPMHGYEVMKALEEHSGCCYRASPGTVYPTLQMLEDQGYVRVVEEEGRKVYHITDAGRAHLDENQDVVEDIAGRVADITSRFFSPEMAEVASRFGRLAQLTFERMVKADPEMTARTKEIIERALRELEALHARGRTGD
ncbi:MAG: PadR family transcriptional regulator [Gemmatimonadetes bacterium]|nr:PadR family transcriptional regulator [Gemmatimonadota bacterium]